MAEHYAARAQEHDFAEVSKAVEGAFGGVIPLKNPMGTDPKAVRKH